MPTTKKKKAEKDVYEHYASGLKEMHAGRFAQALKIFSKLEKDFPDELEVVARARTMSAACERAKEAKTAQKKASQTGEALFDWGVFAHNSGDFDEAIKLFEKALKGSGEDTGHIHYAMAATQVQAGEKKKGLASLSKAIKAEPENRFFAANDADFRSIADDKEFRNLVTAEQ